VNPLDRVEACLDTDRMAQVLQHHLPDCVVGGSRIESLQVTKVRRNASRRRNPQLLSLCYELVLRDASTDRALAQTWFARVYREAGDAGLHRGPETVNLPSLGMVLWRWPHDPGLPQLAGLLDVTQAAAWWGAQAHEVSAIRYEPGDRATLKYTQDVELADAPFDAAPRQRLRSLFAKTFHDDRGRAIHQRFAHFWTLAQADPSAPLVPEPLGYCADSRTLWQAKARGTPLVQCLDLSHNDALPIATARAIAQLHAQPLSLAGAATRHRDHWLQEIERRCRKVARAAPEFADRAARLLASLAMASAQLPEPPASLIHGDFHPEQVWIDEGRVVLFDFDEFAAGDPMEDLAEFVVKLGPIDPGARFATLLLAAYAQASPGQFSQRRLHWHLAVQQLLQASRAFVFQIEGWRGHLELRLARAEALCPTSFQESTR
jgi:hypothetical protein